MPRKLNDNTISNLDQLRSRRVNGLDDGTTSLVHPGRVLGILRDLVLDGLGVRKPDVGDEERDDEGGGRNAHADDDEESLGFVVGTSDSDTLGGAGRVTKDEFGRVGVRLRSQGRVGKVSLELFRYFVGPNSFDDQGMSATCYRA